MKAINKVKASVDKEKYDELMRIKGYLYRLHPDLDPEKNLRNKVFIANMWYNRYRQY